jgi:methylmalonyl-CoA mutase cobalamin-binding subunit
VLSVCNQRLNAGAEERCPGYRAVSVALDALSAAGTEAIYPPGMVIAEAAEQLMNSLNRRLGHTREAAE